MPVEGGMTLARREEHTAPEAERTMDQSDGQRAPLATDRGASGGWLYNFITLLSFIFAFAVVALGTHTVYKQFLSPLQAAVERSLAP